MPEESTMSESEEALLAFLNTADRSELTTLRGIGEAMSGQIVEERGNEQFTSLDDMTDRLPTQTANAVLKAVLAKEFPAYLDDLTKKTDGNLKLKRNDRFAWFMSIKAQFDGRVFVPEGPVDLPVGSWVEIPAVMVGTTSELEEPPLSGLASIASMYPENPDWPEDGAAQHDHYLRGTPKRP
jgi:hypothetical protein